jgi:hypothetical protein
MQTAARNQRAGLFRLWIRVLAVIIGALLFVLAAFTMLSFSHTWKFQRNRVRWKDSALASLAALSVTNAEIRGELEELKEGPKPNLDLGWANQQVLLMTNGEYIVFMFWHGFNNGSVDHLFLGRGSDGRWFYSTYHFCTSMAGVSGDNPPGSISEFARTYFARQFDGKSDECLKRTWPAPN